MDRLIVRCLPLEVRDRYAEEIQDLLHRSRRPLRDRSDLLLAALGLRIGARLDVCLVAAAACLALGVVAVVHSITQLSGGAVEVLDHWWSTFAVAGCTAALMTVALLSIARRRARSWSRPT